MVQTAPVLGKDSNLHDIVTNATGRPVNQVFFGSRVQLLILEEYLVHLLEGRVVDLDIGNDIVEQSVLR